MGYYSTYFLIEKENLQSGIRAIIFDLNAEVVRHINESILDATNSVSIRSAVGRGNDRIVRNEDEAARIG